VAEETRTLMRQMVQAGEVDALVPERVWKETERALAMPTPQRFVEELRECGALGKLFPEIDRLFGIPQPPEYHPEVDTGVHTLLVLEQASKLSSEPQVRFAALVHDVGKGATPKDQWPRHIKHEERGVPLVEQLCSRYRVPNEYRDLAVAVTRHHLRYHRAMEMQPKTILKLLKNLDAFRRPQRFDRFLMACEADERGRTGLENRRCEQTPVLQTALAAAQAVEPKTLVDKGLRGAQIGQELDRLRVAAIKQALSDYR
jgi:tRNA nucleotidyltransferase (CCA-adding enzyme)